jgi:hypothetical protein
MPFNHRKNKGWYLEDNYMEAVKPNLLRKMVNQLCWDIRPDVVALQLMPLQSQILLGTFNSFVEKKRDTNTLSSLMLCVNT